MFYEQSWSMYETSKQHILYIMHHKNVVIGDFLIVIDLLNTK